MNELAHIDRNKTNSPSGPGTGYTVTGNHPGLNTFFQPKLTVNDPNDQYEKEADAVADEVMRMKTAAIQTKTDNHLFFSSALVTIHPVQRKCAHCEEEEKKMQRKEIDGEITTAGNDVDDYIENHDKVTC